ncbi:outer membrane protein assembly factor BamE [Paeniroseomonas aquatica]|uniref:Outer membrane protein assembly factor BamE n=1 Tax=Paeniroseomonas aquatica TaxID=373043 RepID=A0ABT8A3J9_9PROT|nr:outer membrane protein assembly factor BamE [Paeniroseomonas aquatica]MDN3564261.1 outer membrane protein assembly factor BamE [Paeniroseomonas aquatica]
MDRPCRPVNESSAWRPADRRLGLALAGGLLLLAGCSVFDAPVIQRGNRLTEDQLKEITPGVQTRTDVQALLGSPTQSSTFGDPVWYYISSRTRTRPGRELSVTDQQTVVVEFDPRGVVTRVRTLGDEDGRPVAVVARETPTPGNDRTLLQALFGNVGRIGPGASIPTSPGAPGAGTGR